MNSPNQEGDELLASRKVTMSQELLTDYAQQITYRSSAVSRPVVNHHTDPELAEQAGFERPVAEPLQYLAVLDEMMLTMHGKGWLESGEITAKIIGPVYAGDDIEISVALREDSTADSERIVHHYEVVTQGGNVVTVGEASVDGSPDVTQNG